MVKKMRDQDAYLIGKYSGEIAKFRKFCEESSSKTTFEEINFYDLSIGFFISLGVTESSFPEKDSHYDDAFALARICRYTYEYWC